MALFFFGAGGSLVACALAGTPLVLAAALSAAGLFVAIYHPVGTALLVEAAGERPGRAIGVNGVCGNVGVALAPVVTAFLASQGGWQAAFLLPGALCVALGLVWLRLPAAASVARRGGVPFPPIPRHLVRRAVVVLLLIAAASGLVFNAFTVLIPKLMQERLADSPALLPLAGVAATLATLCGAATQLTVGRMIDRMTLRRVFLPMALVLVPSLLALAFARGWLVVPLAGAVAAAVFGQVTVNETMTARYIAPALRVRMYSVRFFVGFLGAAAAPPVVGYLHDRTGSLAAAILLLAGVSLVTLACALFFPDRREELRPELWGGVAQAAE
jgi:MFS family permease